MALPPTATHQRWTRHGRIMRVSDTQMAYVAGGGAMNLEVAPGTYQPYRWDAQGQILYLPGCYISLVPEGIECWCDGDSDPCYTLRFIPQISNDDGVTWEDDDWTLIPYTTRHVSSSGWRECLHIEYVLDTPNQQQTITLEGGCNTKLDIGLTVEAKTAGTYRSKLATASKDEKSTSLATPPGGQATWEKGIDTARCRHRWTKDEWEDRTGATRQAQGRESGGMFRASEPIYLTELYLASNSYTAGESRRVFPDTLIVGPIAFDADDGDESDVSSPTWNVQGKYATGGLYIEAAVGTLVYLTALRWRDIDLGTEPIESIDAGTELVTSTPLGDSQNPENIDPVYIAIEDANNPAVWANTNGERPSDRTRHPTEIGPLPTTGRDQTTYIGDVQVLVSALAIARGYLYQGSGNALNFHIHTTETELASSWWQVASDYDGAGPEIESTLTIQYTPEGGSPPQETQGVIAPQVAITARAISTAQAQGVISPQAAVTARATSTAQGQGVVSSQATVTARAISTAQGQGVISPSVTITAEGFSGTAGAGAISTVATISARATSTATAQGQISTVAALAARSVAIHQVAGEIATEIRILASAVSGLSPPQDIEMGDAIAQTSVELGFSTLTDAREMGTSVFHDAVELGNATR